MYKSGKERVSNVLNSNTFQNIKNGMLDAADETAVKAYNLGQIAKERLFGIGNKEEKEEKTVKAQAGYQEFNIEDEELTEEEILKINKFKTNLEKINKQQKEQMKKDTNRAYGNPKLESKKVEWLEKYTDSKGRTRALSRRKFFDQQKGVMLRGESARSRLAAKIRNQFGLAEGEFTSMMRLTKYSLIKTMGLVTAIMLAPAAISEAADGDVSEYIEVLKAMYFFDYFDDNKKKKGKYEINEKFDKEIQNYRKILANKEARYKDADVPSITREAKKYFKSTIKPIFPGRKFRYLGENTELFVDTAVEVNEIILEQMASKVDMGDVKFKLDRVYLGTKMAKKRNTKKLFGKHNIKKYNKRREVNEIIANNNNIALTMIQIESQENLEREMKSIGVNVEKEYLQNNRDEQMRNVISEFVEKIDSKVDNTTLIAKVEDYALFVKEAELKQNKTIEEKAEESKRELEIKKIMSETLINRVENEKELSEEKLNEEIKNIIIGNNIDIFSKEQIQEIQNMAKEKIANMYSDEVVSRKNEIEKSVNYMAESSTSEEKRKVKELKNRKIDELTIRDLKELKKNRVKAYIEQDRVIQNIKLYNIANANLGKQGVSESQLAKYFFDKGNEKYKNKVYKKVEKSNIKAKKKKNKIEERIKKSIDPLKKKSKKQKKQK